MTKPVRLIIDTDPGVDDAVAILMALAAPVADVVGLTTVGGNVNLARATRNALALLQAAGRTEVPVVKGAARPLRGRFSPSVAFHGPGGLSVRLPDPAIRPVNQSAVDFIADRLSRHPRGITVVALGPLTNLARLLQRHPDALAKAHRIVVMGGAVNTPGNVTSKAEFNIHSDPVATDMVLSSGLPITLADLAACRQVAINRQQALRLTVNHRVGHPLGQLALRLIQNWFRHDPTREKFEFYDPLAVALALEPGLASVRQVNLDVGTSDADDWGETTVVGGVGEVALADEVDGERFFRVLREMLGWEGI
jgi:inosine-uridine nucleoside N-ribohydrolase